MHQYLDEILNQVQDDNPTLIAADFVIAGLTRNLNAM